MRGGGMRAPVLRSCSLFVASPAPACFRSRRDAVSVKAVHGLSSGGGELGRVTSGGNGSGDDAAVRAFANQGPPAGYNHSEDGAADAAWAVNVHPELKDLFDAGVVVAVMRPAAYVERRSDGYQEPEVVFLVGTDHWSNESAGHVGRVIAAVGPQCVVVELCRSRSGVLYLDDADASDSKAFNSTGLWGRSPWEAALRSARLGGQSGLLMQIAVSAMYGSLMRAAGTVPGTDMRAARAAAEACGAQVVLGDRPIEITLRRAWDLLGRRDRLAVLAALVGSGMRGGEEVRARVDAVRAQAAERSDLRAGSAGVAGTQGVASGAGTEASVRTVGESGALRGSGLADDLAGVMQREGVPQGLARAMLHERDLYLGWTLKRSRAVNGCRTVVGVVGKGHVRGVTYVLRHFHNHHLRFRDLAGLGGDEGGVGRWVRLVVREGTLGVLFAVALWLWTNSNGAP